MTSIVSEVLRNVEIVIRGCPFPVDASISNVAEERAGLFTTNESGEPVGRSEVVEMVESDMKSPDFRPSTDETTS